MIALGEGYCSFPSQPMFPLEQHSGSRCHIQSYACVYIIPIDLSSPSMGVCCRLELVERGRRALHTNFDLQVRKSPGLGSEKCRSGVIRVPTAKPLASAHSGGGGHWNRKGRTFCGRLLTA